MGDLKLNGFDLVPITCILCTVLSGPAD